MRGNMERPPRRGGYDDTYVRPQRGRYPPMRGGDRRDEFP